MLRWFTRLFKSADPLAQPCSCGREARACVAPEREAELSQAHRYCLECLTAVIRDGLAGVTERWVVVQPFADAECFVPYRQDELAEFDDFKAWPAQINNLLNSAESMCQRCPAKTSQWVWLPTDAKQTVPSLQADRHWFSGKTTVALCSSCLADSLLRSLRERDIKLWELVLPGRGSGVWLPWGY